MASFEARQPLTQKDAGARYNAAGERDLLIGVAGARFRNVGPFCFHYSGRKIRA